MPESQRGLHAYLDAWDPVEQRRRWRVELPNLFDRGGVLATAGNLVAQGMRLFAQDCGRCHLNNTTRGVSPDLRRMSAGTHEIFKQIVLKGLLRPQGMPQWDDVLSESQVDAIHAYLISLAWSAYDQEHASRSHAGAAGAR